MNQLPKAPLDHHDKSTTVHKDLPSKDLQVTSVLPINDTEPITPLIISANMVKDTPNKNENPLFSEKTEKDAESRPEATLELLTKPTSEPIPEAIPEFLTEPASEPAPEPVCEPTPEPTPEAIPELLTEPTSEPAPEPVCELTPEPTPEAIPELLTEPTSEPAPELTPELESNEPDSKQLLLDSFKELMMQKQHDEPPESPLSAPATPALTPPNRLSAANSTCSRRSSDTGTTHHTTKEKFPQAIKTSDEPFDPTSIPQEYNIMTRPAKSNSTSSKNRFSSIRLKRKKTVNKDAPEDSDPQSKPKSSVSSKIQDRLKKSGKRISKIFM